MDGKKYLLLGYDAKGSPVYEDARIVQEMETAKADTNATDGDNSQTAENELENPQDFATMDLNRQSKNAGAFAELPERMSKKHIRALARECKIPLEGISLNIDMNEELLRIGLTGRVDPEHIGGITFFPNAFRTKEELLRTLFHEKVHVKQFKEFGVEFVQNNRAHFEKLAYAEENEFIENLKKAGKL